MSEGKKSRKVGRNKNVCLAYKTSQRREFNKARRIKKYLRRHPAEKNSWVALEKLSKVLYAAQRSELGIIEFLKTRT